MAANPDGSFSFRVVPDRNTRYRVTLAGTQAAALVQVSVADPPRFSVDPLPLGRARVTVELQHSREGSSGWSRPAPSGAGRTAVVIPRTHAGAVVTVRPARRQPERLVFAQHVDAVGCPLAYVLLMRKRQELRPFS